MILRGQNQLKQAAASFRLAVKLAPEDGASFRNLGEVLTQLGNLEEAIQYFARAVKIDPDDADTHYNLAVALTGLGQHRQAVHHYGQVLRVRPGWPPAANNLAWILSTHPDPNIRDGARALPLAEEACQKVHFRDPTGLDTLAAAQAEASQFDAAIRTSQRAIEIARSQGNQSLVDKLSRRLRLYQAKQAYRDPHLHVPRP
jgi:tetratricopeptide (TPR) repeat protein